MSSSFYRLYRFFFVVCASSAFFLQSSQGSEVDERVRNFCISASKELTEKHILPNISSAVYSSYDSNAVLNYLLADSEEYTVHLLLNHPFRTVRKAAYFLQQSRFEKIRQRNSNDSLLDLWKGMNAFSSFEQRELNSFNEQYYPQNNDYSDSTDSSTAAKLCLLTPTHGCGNALKFMFELGAIHRVPDDGRYNGTAISYTSLTLFHDVSRFFTTPSMVRMMGSMALTLDDYVRNGIPSSETENWYELIQRLAAKEANTSQTKDELTWKAIALYAARGSSVESLVGPMVPPKSHFFNLLHASANVYAALGPLSLENESRPYALPLNVKSSCVFGKPYRFWAGAYFAHAAVAAGHSRKASAIAAHWMGLLYEVFYKTVFRNLEDPFREDLNSPGNKMVRMNLVHNDAGAIFGAYPKSKKIDLDSALGDLMEVQAPKINLSSVYNLLGNHSSQLLEFIDRFHAHEAFEMMLEKADKN